MGRYTILSVALAVVLGIGFWWTGPTDDDVATTTDDASRANGPMVDVALPEALSANAEIGKLAYDAKCAACHGQKGEGLVGPNFTDSYWISGGGIKNVFTTIKYGVPEKGMISWKSLLKPSEMQDVGSYILKLEGTDPPNQKASEGEFWDSSAENEPEDDANELPEDANSEM